TTILMLPNDFIMAVSEAVRYLLASFNNFTKAYRRTYRLTRARVSRTRDAYS
ncbi:unnamed protein product, partial [Penicillium nalgiovense]